MTSINIPSSVTSLGFNPFLTCSGLKSIYVNWETPIKAFGSRAFKDVDKEACTLYVPTGTYDKYQQTSPWSNFQNIVEYDNNTITLSKAGTLPEKIGKIEKYYITNLKVIGDINGTDLKLIRSMAGCDYDYEKHETRGRLTKLDLSEANIVSGGDAYYDSFRNVYYYTEDNKIGKYAFYDCSKLASIDFPLTVTKVDSCAFGRCSGLKSINIPSSVTEIGSSAFYECNSLTSINIPSSVTKIDSFTFFRCKCLASINIPSSITEIGKYAFYECRGLKSIDLPSSITEIGKNAFYECDSLTSINIPSSVTTIGVGVFFGCRGLTSIDIPSSVTEIGNCAFQECSSLTNIDIPSSVTKIGSQAFYRCRGLTSINIPERVDTIFNLAFYGCSKLPTLSLPSAIKFVGDNAFYNCENLTSVYANSKTPSEIDEPYRQEYFDKYNLAERCTLYVPKGSVEAYSSSNWHLYFNDIKEFDVETGVQTIVSSPQSTEISRYDINGRKMAKLAKGINIIKYSDGSIRKEFVK